MKKKEFAAEIKTLYDFSYFLMHIKPYLEFTWSKSTINTREQDMKHVKFETLD